ncbi:type I-G CRISPR-associated helicase/endonuclease Cas3g [Mobilicoccus caccae]|uniref:HD Cas3-type domain-containing protein n=1 Tax=Mobilicoccus caccae TaxID=1859295 RepID=A0ABQ6IV23_9MICO|nr:type I-U CRISPR-associated helicase/endonuclease Cas3 [Mobilicoccus caccae]GMA41220.1 hypothetical protein GCM10025883_32650 [Mobilicoccus caccae]
MEPLNWDDFPAFFASVHGGARPFAWQTRLLDAVHETGEWPDLVAAPTGAGKGALATHHVFLNAMSAGSGLRVPRRLVTVVNRRGLVDSLHQRAEDIAAALVEAPAGSLLWRVRERLRTLSPRPDAPPLAVVELRGGIPPRRGWVDDPEVCSVISATPDMWGSRVLFRGYGSGRFARPREAGLLAYDAVMALDETHLNRQIALTARRVRQLEAPYASVIGVPRLQVVELSATPPVDADIAPETVVRVEPSDLDVDPVLEARLTTPKPVRYVESPSWPAVGRPSAAHIEALVKETQTVRNHCDFTEGSASTVGCFVNRVDTAVHVADGLRRRGLRVEVWVGRMRPYDLLKLRKERPGLFSTEGDTSVDVLVATQTVEVGVDIDLAGLVTELASGSAIAQRAGRINRLGRRSTAPIHVMGPGREHDIARDCPPYHHEELESARRWLLGREQTPEGLAPYAVVADPPPDARRARPVYERLERGDSEKLAMTSDAAFVDPELSLWLRDDLRSEADPVFVVPRALHGLADEVAQSLLSVTPVVPLEVFPASVREGRALVERLLSGDEHEASRAFLVEGADVSPISGTEDVRPGAVIVVDATHPLVSGHVVTSGVPLQRVDPTFWHDTVPPHAGPDVGVVHRPGQVGPDDVDWCEYLTDLDADAALHEYAAVKGDVWELTLPPRTLQAEGEPLPWVVARPKVEVAADDEARQEWSRSSQVALDIHQNAVGQRAFALATAMALPPEMAETVREAGLHHDDGKVAPFFQAILRGHEPGVGEKPLAKSGTTARDGQRRRRAQVMPAGWRHEQWSVVRAVEQGVTDPLTMRLIGASHGRGRAGFPHTTGDLLTGLEADRRVAEALFDRGEWDALIDETHARYGVWGCAYLEAILRAADCQISGEGS